MQTAINTIIFHSEQENLFQLLFFGEIYLKFILESLIK